MSFRLRFSQFRDVAKRFLPRRWWLLALLIGVGAWLRWPGLHKPFEEAEAVTLYSYETFVLYGWLAPFRVNHLLHLLGNRMMGFGSIGMIRLPYMLVGLAGIPLAWWLGRIWKSWVLTFVLAFLMVIWPYKLFWDDMTREYTLVMASGLLRICLWERYRLQPSWMNLIVASMVSIAASQTHEMAIVCILLPTCYMAWSLCCLGWDAWRKRGEESPGLWRPFGRWAGQLAVAVLATHLALMLAVGSSYMRHFAIEKSPEDAQLAVLAVEPNPAVSAKKPAGPNVPSLAEATEYSLKALGLVFQVKNLSPAPLFGLDPKLTQASTTHFFDRMMWANVGLSPKLMDRMEVGLLALFVLGWLVTLRRSPPLSLGLSMLILATGLLIASNLQIRTPQIRYYTLPAVAFVVLAAVGLCQVLNWLRAPLYRFLPRWDLRLMRALALGAVLWAAWPYAQRAHRVAAYSNDDWGSFYRYMRVHYPTGVLFHGLATYHFWVYNEIEKAHEKWQRRLGVAIDDEHSASHVRISQLRDAYEPADLRILDQMPPGGGIALCRPTYYRAPFKPLQDTSLFSLKEYRNQSVTASYGSAGNTCFLMRGKGRLALYSNLRTEATYQLTCRIEVPGSYQLLIRTHANDVLKRMVWNGEEVPFQPTHDQDSTVWSALISTTAEGLDAQSLALEFNQPPVEAPALEWELQSNIWRPVSPSVEMGAIQIKREGSGYNFSIPLRMTDLQDDLYQVVIRMGPSNNDMLTKRWDVMVNESRRGVQYGDCVWSGKLEVDQAVLNNWIGKPAELSLMPLRLSVATNDPLLPWVSGNYLRVDELRSLLTPKPRKIMARFIFERVDGQVVIRPL